MRLPVIADDACAVHTENNMQILQRHIVQNHIVCPLQEA